MANPWDLDWSKKSATDDNANPWERDWASSQTPQQSTSQGGGVKDSLLAIKAGIGGQLISTAGTALDNPAAFAKATGIAIADTALTGLPRLWSAANRWAGGDGSLPFDMDRGAQELHSLFTPAYEQVGAELAQSRQEADKSGAVSSTLRKFGSAMQESAKADMSDAAKALDQEYEKTQGFGAAKFLATHPGKLLDMTLENLPSQLPLMAAGMGAGVVARTIAGAAAKKAGTAAIGEAMQSPALRAAVEAGDAAAANTVKDAGAQAAQAAAQKAMDAAQPYLTALNIGGESSMTVAQTADAIHSGVQKAKPEDLANLPLYRQYLEQTGNDKDARAMLAARLTTEWAPIAGMGTAFGSIVTGGAKAEASALAGQVSGYKEAAKGVGKEMVEEAIQSPLEDAGQYGALSQVNPNETLDPIKSSIEGAAVSMGHSGAIQFAKPVYDSARRGYQFAKDLKSPSTNQGASNGNEAQAPSQAPSQEVLTPAGGAPENASPAEKALEPKNLTDLDRVAEIDTELARLNARQQELKDPAKGYGPMFDQERTEIAQQKFELGMRREELAKNWPKAETGAATSFTTEAGSRVEAKYALMDAGDLVTSHDEGLRANPEYPAELQPRDPRRLGSLGAGFQ